ncbi:hypothetical protein CALVIDRAFT_557825 [Calocera viscosa TUFC12733]|uniref:Aminoglycoside phosphotransferase domain-containing protein n=1 Tax=Calocera viscosa (strain TUFC12733) TaxID=1330018 RepID=A0A167HUK8_CALVF|nr:hypothetical protein CALVIDRAFT_557825 [Calocera viscosa TUFC12733]
MSVPRYRGTPICLDDYTYDDIPDTYTNEDLCKEIKSLDPYDLVDPGPSTIFESFEAYLQIRDALCPLAVVFRFCQEIKTISCLDMASEVITMRHVRQDLAIPAPKVYGYSTDGRFASTQFIVTDVPRGVPLDVAWPDLVSEARERFVDSYEDLLSKLSNDQYRHIGALTAGNRPGRIDVGGLSRLTMNIRRRTDTPSHGTRKSNFEMWLRDLLLEEEGVVADRRQAALERSRPLDVPDENLFATHAKFLTGIQCRSIFVDPGTGPTAGQITAVVDWDETNVLPIWMLKVNLTERIGSYVKSRWNIDAVENVDPHHPPVPRMNYFPTPRYRQAMRSDLDNLRDLMSAIERGSGNDLAAWYNIHLPELERRHREELAQAAQNAGPSAVQPGPARRNFFSIHRALVPRSSTPTAGPSNARGSTARKNDDEGYRTDGPRKTPGNRRRYPE